MTTTKDAPVKKPINKWSVAALLTIGLGHILAVLVGLVYATVIISANPITGDQAGWNVLAFIILPFQVIDQGYASIFSVVAAVLAIIGLVKRGKSTLGIIVLVLTLLFSLKVIDLVQTLF